jgi:hypothetical protein
VVHHTAGDRLGAHLIFGQVLDKFLCRNQAERENGKNIFMHNGFPLIPQVRPDHNPPGSAFHLAGGMRIVG